MFSVRNPLKRMRDYRDRADRIGLRYLEEHAVAGTITPAMVETVADALNRDVRTLVSMIPDRRSERRYRRAMEGLRKANLVQENGEPNGVRRPGMMPGESRY